jgi:hypothetical protein
MNFKEQLTRLAAERNTPCVTISLNTHRTHPENKMDEIELKKLLVEAEARVINEFEKRPVAALLEKINSVASEIDVNYNLDSLHIFLSNDTKEIVKSTWKSEKTGVQISESFAVRPIIKMYNRQENYLLMLLSQSGVQLFEVLNETIVEEIRNEDFPFSETRYYNTHSDKGSDSNHLDNLVREFFNKVDKALVRAHQETNLKCVVICTEDNYSRLQQVADKPEIYLGYDAIDYNKVAPHQISNQAWIIVSNIQKQRRASAIDEMHEAVAGGKVITDLQEIYQAAIDGRGDLLIVFHDYAESVLMTDERTFEIINDPTIPNAIDDITSNIAWEVISKKGRVVFTMQDEIKKIGEIALKIRY